MAFPTFQVTDNAGNPIAGASVVLTSAIEPVPEPGTWALMVLALTAVGLIKCYAGSNFCRES